MKRWILLAGFMLGLGLCTAIAVLHEARPAGALSGPVTDCSARPGWISVDGAFDDNDHTGDSNWARVNSNSIWGCDIRRQMDTKPAAETWYDVANSRYPVSNPSTNWADVGDWYNCTDTLTSTTNDAWNYTKNCTVNTQRTMKRDYYKNQFYYLIWVQHINLTQWDGTPTRDYKRYSDDSFGYPSEYAWKTLNGATTLSTPFGAKFKCNCHQHEDKIFNFRSDRTVWDGVDFPIEYSSRPVSSSFSVPRPTDQAPSGWWHGQAATSVTTTTLSNTIPFIGYDADAYPGTPSTGRTATRITYQNTNPGSPVVTAADWAEGTETYGVSWVNGGRTVTVVFPGNGTYNLCVAAKNVQPTGANPTTIKPDSSQCYTMIVNAITNTVPTVGGDYAGSSFVPSGTLYAGTSIAVRAFGWDIDRPVSSETTGYVGNQTWITLKLNGTDTWWGIANQACSGNNGTCPNWNHALVGNWTPTAGIYQICAQASDVLPIGAAGPQKHQVECQTVTIVAAAIDAAPVVKFNAGPKTTYSASVNFQAWAQDDNSTDVGKRTKIRMTWQAKIGNAWGPEYSTWSEYAEDENGNPLPSTDWILPSSSCTWQSENQGRANFAQCPSGAYTRSQGLWIYSDGVYQICAEAENIAVGATPATNAKVCTELTVAIYKAAIGWVMPTTMIEGDPIVAQAWIYKETISKGSADLQVERFRTNPGQFWKEETTTAKATATCDKTGCPTAASYYSHVGARTIDLSGLNAGNYTFVANSGWWGGTYWDAWATLTVLPKPATTTTTTKPVLKPT